MKAEERHELEEKIEQNDLAAALARVKALNRRRAALWVGVAVLVFLAVLYLRYYQTKTADDDADRWISLLSATDKEALKVLMESPKFRGKEVGYVAKMKYARLLLATDGLDKLATSDAKKRQAAANTVEEAEKLFIELTKELGSNQMLVQEAWLDAARAEESLLAVPKSETDTSSRGDYDTVLKYLESAAKISPESEAGKRIQEKIDEAKKNRDQRIAFYVELQASLFVKKIPEAEDSPGAPKKGDAPLILAPETPGPSLKAPEAPKPDAKPKEQPGELKVPVPPDTKAEKQMDPVPPVEPKLAPPKEPEKKEPEKK